MAKITSALDLGRFFVLERTTGNGIDLLATAGVYPKIQGSV